MYGTAVHIAERNPEYMTLDCTGKDPNPIYAEVPMSSSAETHDAPFTVLSM